MNLLLVTFDCARADVFEKLHLPSIERLQQHSSTFLKAYSCAPLTPISHASILSGLLPENHGLRNLFRSPLPENVKTFPEILSDCGWRTAAIVSCPGLSSWYKMDRGFDHYDDWVPTLPDGQDGLSVNDVKLRGLALKRADMVVDRSIEWLRHNHDKGAWFLFSHFFDAHWPYEPPELNKQAKNGYEGEILFAEKHFQRLLDFMEDLGQLDDTLIVIEADHGEDLSGWYENDKSGEGNTHPEEEGHGCCLYEQTQRVPLIFAHPSFSKRIHSHPVSLIDIAPTVLSILGADDLVCDGIDLSQNIIGDSFIPERTIYAETRYPRELVDNTGKYSHIANLQCAWLNTRKKVIRIEKDPYEFIEFDLSKDPNEMKPKSLSINKELERLFDCKELDDK